MELLLITNVIKTAGLFSIENQVSIKLSFTIYETVVRKRKKASLSKSQRSRCLPQHDTVREEYLKHSFCSYSFLCKSKL